MFFMSKVFYKIVFFFNVVYKKEEKRSRSEGEKEGESKEEGKKVGKKKRGRD